MQYKELFSSSPIIKKLTLIQLLAYFAAWFSNVAIFTLLIELNSSSFIISLVTAMHFIPGLILSPINGSIIDKVEARKLMLILMVTELTMTFCFLFINTIEEVWILICLIFIRMSAASMFFTTEMSLLPKLLKGDLLAKANEIHSIIWSFTFTAGMAIGGLVVYVFGIKTAIIIDLLLFITAIILVYNTDFQYSHPKIKTKIIQSIKEGVTYLKKNRHLFHFIFLHASVGLTAFDSLVALLADFHYKFIIAVPLAIGITNATRSIALMIGPFLISKWINKENIYWIFIFQGFSIVIWGLLQESFYIALIGSFLTGLVTTTLWSHTYAMLQEKVDGQYLGRVLAYNEMFFMLSMSVTTIFIGVMATFVGLDIITIFLGIMFIFVAFYYKKVLNLGL